MYEGVRGWEEEEDERRRGRGGGGGVGRMSFEGGGLGGRGLCARSIEVIVGGIERSA